MKWLCVHLPRLSLETHLRGLPSAPGTDGDSAGLATIESTGSRRWIHDCDAVAEKLGLRGGMRLDTAYALAPRLRALPRNPEGEARLLELVALQAWRLSDRVAIEAPDRVLVEVAGSRRLIGRRPISEHFSLPDVTLAFSLAPTPRAAVLLARARRYRALRDLDRLDGIALQHSELDADTLRALTGLGVTRLGQLRALPRDGLRRRVGASVLTYLDRLRGRSADSLPWFTPPERFDSVLDLMEETDRVEALLFGASRLLRELGAFLEVRDVAIQRFVLRLQHEAGARTELTVGLAEPDRAPERLIALLRERMSHLALPGPVRRLELAAGDLVSFGTVNGDLFETATGSEVHAWARLQERLRARLGQDAVKQLATVPEHAPERAWESRPLMEPREKLRRDRPRNGEVRRSDEQAIGAGADRPLWLLRAPEPLASAHRLTLESGPERIETGWWEDRDIARDYYVARADGRGEHSRRLWVYRDCRGERRWYLHGFFA